MARQQTLQWMCWKPSQVSGYVPFIAGHTDGEIELDYYTDGENHLPKLFIDELMGGSENG